jgi:hypothetical protein
MAVTTHVDDAMPEAMTDSLSEYDRHLESLQARFDRALQAASLEAALVHSGLLLPAFRDDQSYPKCR